MTRKKKTRSLKRIHSVKTGNASKLKRDGDTDRQFSNLKTKDKPKSVYQKFLEQNPDAIEKQPQSKAAVSEKADKQENTLAKQSATKSSKPAPKTTTDKADRKPEREKRSGKEHDTPKERTSEREPDLLSQLDNKSFKDFY